MLTSVPELVALHTLGWTLFAYLTMPDLADSAVQEELFAWAADHLRYPLHSAFLGATIGPVSSICIMLVWAFLPSTLQTRFPLRFGIWGSPPFVGALLSVVLSGLVLWGLVQLSSLED